MFCSDARRSAEDPSTPVSFEDEVPPETEQDLWPAALESSLAGAWLAAETALANSLWMAIGTCAAGLLAGLLLVRRQAANQSQQASS